MQPTQHTHSFVSDRCSIGRQSSRTRDRDYGVSWLLVQAMLSRMCAEKGHGTKNSVTNRNQSYSMEAR